MQKEKSNFILGLAVGVAAVSLIGFIMIAVAYFGYGDLKLADDKKDTNVVQVDTNKPAPTPSPTPTPTLTKVNIEVSDNDYIRGNKNAKITIVEFSDIQCPYCSRFHNTMKQIMTAYPNDVRWIYKHFPLDSIHPYARKAAEATECAGDQEKYWEYLDYLFDNQSSIKSVEYLSTAASSVGLNTSTFNSCLSDGKYVSKVNDDFNEGRSAGVTGTPGSVINGELIKGAVSFDTLKAKIETLK